jgi:hypothetical protein
VNTDDRRAENEIHDRRRPADCHDREINREPDPASSLTRRHRQCQQAREHQRVEAQIERVRDRRIRLLPEQAVHLKRNLPGQLGEQGDGEKAPRATQSRTTVAVSRGRPRCPDGGTGHQIEERVGDRLPSGN